jgi:hypothetical protein
MRLLLTVYPSSGHYLGKEVALWKVYETFVDGAAWTRSTHFRDSL